MESPLVAVEHMEDHPTRWLVEEYVEAAREAARAGLGFVVTGVRDPRLQAILSKKGVEWEWRHSWELYDMPGTIVLDMWASRDLEVWEAQQAKAFVVGGIMGDYPPRGRGRLLSWMFDWASTRRLGEAQLSIHTSVWALAMVRGGVPVNRLPLCPEGASFEADLGFYRVEVTLPFAYPCGEDGSPRVPPRIRNLLARGIVWDEEVLSF